MRVGTDGEFAVSYGDMFVPAGVLATYGRKGNPEMLKYGGVEIDCCALEITPPPAQSANEFASNITRLINEAKQKFSGYELVTKASHKFPLPQLDIIRYANEMGCQPDYCVWTEQENDRPRSEDGLRTFGGHVHIEGGNPSTVKACDLTLGMWSVLKDHDVERRKLYGRAGAFRFKPYGIEYRVLSNFWYKDEAHMKRVFELSEVAMDLSHNIDALIKKYGGPDTIQDIINSSRDIAARAILDDLKVNYGT